MALLGIDPRRYLDLLLAHPEVPRAPVGKLRVVALDDVRALLQRLAVTGDDGEAANEPTAANVDADDELKSADDVLRRLGLRRSA